MGSEELYAPDLRNTLQWMRDANKFKKLVFYMEACESGSMFEGWEIDGVFAVSAASPTESSWAQYCGPDAVVSGVDIGSCLGDEFSVAWMEDSDATDTTTETLNDQFQIVKARTPDSHVNMWGDTTFASDMLSTYIGNLPEVSVTADVVTADVASRSSASAREVDLARLFRKYMMAPSPADRIKVGQVLQKELQGQLEVEAAYTRFVALAYPDDVAKQQACGRERQDQAGWIANDPLAMLSKLRRISTRSAHLQCNFTK